jgi:hypothetical protein
MSFVENVGVIIRKLVSRFHIANRLDPDSFVLDHCIAVGIARVIDESGFIPIDLSVDDDIIIYREKIRVMTVPLVVGISSVCLSRCKSLTGVLDESRSGRYPRCGESTQSLNRRRAYPKFLVSRTFALPSNAESRCVLLLCSDAPYSPLHAPQKKVLPLQILQQPPLYPLVPNQWRSDIWQESGTLPLNRRGRIQSQQPTS